GRPNKFDGKTVTSSFRIPKVLFEDGEEYKDLRVLINDFIEKFYESYKERKRFKEKVKRNIHRGFRSFSEFTSKNTSR
ncbi:MAG: hypothetical protein ACXAAH_13435, partial [Promethearchaeota archaeon]